MNDGEKKRAKMVRGAVLLALAVGLLYLVFRPGGDGSIRLEDVRREQVADGVELLEARLVRAGRGAGTFAVLYAKPDAVELALAMNDERRPLHELAEDATLVANAGYFTKEWRATGLLASQGHILSPFVKNAGGAGSGVLVVEDGEIELLERDRVGDKKFRGADIAIQAGPRVIEPTRKRGIKSDDGLRANRTFIGADTSGRFVLGVAYSGDGAGAIGPTLYELQSLLLDDRLQIAFCLNLDGGPSTGFDLRADDVRRQFGQKARVRSVLTVTTKR